VFEELGCPDYVVVPVGNAGNISAIWKGFKELAELGLCRRLPKMVGVQAEGAAPLAKAWERGAPQPFFIDEPETVATAIKIGKPVNWPKALAAVKESGGLFVTVSDVEILRAQKLLASRDGIGAEPAGAASVAAALKLKLSGTAVAVVTGHALKDPDAVEISAREVRNAEELVELLER